MSEPQEQLAKVFDQFPSQNPRTIAEELKLATETEQNFLDGF